MSVSVSLALLLGLPLTSHAYEHTVTDDGSLVRWDRPIVTVGTTHLESPETRAAVAHAVTEWAKAAGPGLEIRLARAQTPDVLVTSVPDEAWSVSDDFLAVTSVHHDGTGRIQHVLIELKRSETDRATQTYDLQAVVAHELGHALGMAHEMQLEEPTMSPTLAPGPSPKRHLHEDDVRGIQSLYPKRSDTVGCGSTSAVPGQGGGLLVGVLAFGAALGSRPRKGART